MQSFILLIGARRWSFCDQLRYLIIAGSEGFSDQTGRRVVDDTFGDEQIYVGSQSLGSSSACYVLSSRDYGESSEYVCTFGDESTTTPSALEADLARLDAAVDSCLVRQVWPGFTRDGRSSPRYFRSHDIAISSNLPPRVEELAWRDRRFTRSYLDWYHFDQHIEVGIFGPERGSDTLILDFSVGTLAIVISERN